MSQDSDTFRSRVTILTLEHLLRGGFTSAETLGSNLRAIVQAAVDAAIEPTTGKRAKTLPDLPAKTEPVATPQQAPTEQPASAPAATGSGVQAQPTLPASVAPATTVATEPAKPAAPDVDKAHLVKVVTEIATALGRNAVIEVLKRYGAESVPTLKPEHYGAVHADLVELRQK